MTRLVIEKDKIVHNLQVIREKAGGGELIAVLKADAYGLGLLPMAGLLREQGVRRFGVTEPRDAARLREAGFVEEEILMLRSTSLREDIQIIVDSLATAAVGSYDAAVALSGAAEEQGTALDVHLEIDTGMGRYGFMPSEIERILSIYRYMGSLNVTGMFTHFPSAFSNKKATLAQQQALLDTAAKVRQAGFEPGMLHAANSAALFHCGLPPLDGVRVGSAISGRTTGVGYGPAFVTRKPTQIAVIPLGYWEGFLVEKSRDSYRFRDAFRYCLGDAAKWLRRKRFYVTINGRRARVLGHVGLNHVTADVTQIECHPGDPVAMDVSPMFVPEQIPRVYQ